MCKLFLPLRMFSSTINDEIEIEKITIRWLTPHQWLEILGRSSLNTSYGCKRRMLSVTINYVGATYLRTYCIFTQRALYKIHPIFGANPRTKKMTTMFEYRKFDNPTNPQYKG